MTCMYLQAEIKGAHEFAMLSLAWHPAGHLLASGGQVRAAPGSSAVLCKCMTHYNCRVLVLSIPVRSHFCSGCKMASIQHCSRVKHVEL